MENQAATAIFNTLKQAPHREIGGGRKKGLEVASTDFSEDEIENESWSVGKRKKHQQ